MPVPKEGVSATDAETPARHQPWRVEVDVPVNSD